VSNEDEEEASATEAPPREPETKKVLKAPKKRVCKNWLTTYRQYTDNTESPDSFHTFTGLWTLAGAMQRKCWFNYGMAKVFPNLYIVLVAPPGVARKTSAMRIGAQMLKDLDMPMVSSTITREALIQRAANSPQDKLYDGHKLIRHHSLNLASDEFAVFLGENNFPMIGMLTDWYDCANPWSYETKGSGTQTINGIWFNMIACSTSQWLGQALPSNAGTGGFTSRIIFVVENRKRKDVAIPYLTDLQRDQRKMLMLDLLWINENIWGEFNFTPDGRKYFEEIYKKISSQPRFSNSPHMAGYWERKPGHIIKLSMPIHISTKSTKQIDEEDLELATLLLEEREYRMEDAYSTLGANRLAPLQHQVMEVLRQLGQVDFGQLNEFFWRDMSESELTAVMSSLVTMGFCRESHTSKGITYIMTKGKKK
jgi:hypothetical protein